MSNLILNFGSRETVVRNTQSRASIKGTGMPASVCEMKLDTVSKKG